VSSARDGSMAAGLMTVKVSEADRSGNLKFFISYAGLSWFTTVPLMELQKTVDSLR